MFYYSILSHQRVSVKFYIIAIAQDFGSRKFWQTGVQEYFGGQNIDGLAALHSKSARIKIICR